MRRATLWLCFLCACQAPPATQFEIVRPFSLAQCAREFAFLGGRDVLTVGRLETYTFPVRAGLVCDGVQKPPEAFIVEAVDDVSAPVPVEVRVDAPDFRRPGVFDVHVTLRTPDTSAVNIRLRVEPSIGQHQQSIPAVRTQTRSWVPFNNGLGNDGVLEGPDGRELFIGSGRVRIILRSGEVWERSGVAAVGVTPNRVWLVAEGIEAYRFDATAEGVLAGSWPLRLEPSAIASRGQKVFMAGMLPSGVAFLQLDESGVIAGPTRVEPPLVIGAARFVNDDEVLVARGEQLDVVRPAALDGSVSLSGSPAIRPLAVSNSAEGLWLTDTRQASLNRPDGGRATLALTTGPVSPLLPPMVLADVVPIWQLGETTSNSHITAVPVDSPDGGLAWQYLETPGGMLPIWSSSRWIFAKQNSVLFRAPRLP